MAALRTAASFLIAALTAFFMHAYVYQPYRCNRIAKVTKAMALAALDTSDPLRAARLARTAGAQAVECLEHEPAMIDLYMVAALSRRILSEREEAIAFYSQALQYDRRPEIYLQIGLTNLEMGRQAEAREPLRRAIAFDKTMADEVPETHRGELR